MCLQRVYVDYYNKLTDTNRDYENLVSQSLWQQFTSMSQSIRFGETKDMGVVVVLPLYPVMYMGVFKHGLNEQYDISFIKKQDINDESI